MSVPELTRGERTRLAVKTAFRDFLIAHGYPPSRVELAACTGISQTTVQETIDALVATGALRRPRHGALALPEREWHGLLG